MGTCQTPKERGDPFLPRKTAISAGGRHTIIRLFIAWWCCATVLLILAVGWVSGVLLATLIGLLLVLVVRPWRRV